MTGRPSTLRSYTAMLLVALWALQPLAAVLHAREHSHHYCPEHQTFEETARGAGPWQPQRASSPAVLAALRAEPGGEAALTAHEACPLLTASPRGDEHAPAARTVLVAPLSPGPPATAPPGSLCSVPILATAPKASPPARA